MPEQTKTVLLVDDEVPWLEAIRMSVKGAAFRIITADSGEAALAAMQRKKPDLILSDVRMPTMNGFDLFERVKQDPNLRAVPYVFMSSIDDFDAKKTARDLGADGYVEKPFDSDDIKTVVLDLLTRFKK